MIVEPARAKLNLALHVRRRRADGYHELETLFAFVALGDEVRLGGEGEGLRVTGPFAPALGDTADNLVTRAAVAFASRFGLDTIPPIELVKHLPVASGIGGGSADAAATLRALARHCGRAPDDPALFEIAAALGSDVPACLLGRTALGRGRGEALEPLAGLPPRAVLLVNPGVAVSTAEVFRRWDGIDRGPLPDGEALEAAQCGRNDLEAPACAVAPVIADVLGRLAEQPGALLVRMSGSGATCFALYDSAAACAAAAAAIRTARPRWWCAETILA
ncbi:4-(cytidine 5'-diphospho)-2-C-methyl-D-erythritol kinase [Sphingosinithalassobacter sp. CS137]|uniref:4-(cytidine 5'-diphospho)-2-C-methyl-D-erythritol kinase n=1 Tax=Sphingosinithalassobacter sp. CS137 TaxID=2762748 RepID=UPI00165E315B|nr:4-(cytidine 5'-diphospho)-2-C-methyl-D-erythritol kinase [Sphingosinithalassobacter sp. CS137]